LLRRIASPSPDRHSQPGDDARRPGPHHGGPLFVASIDLIGPVVLLGTVQHDACDAVDV